VLGRQSDQRVGGPDLVVAVSGFGDTVHDALRDLADNLVQEVCGSR
jgi:hypothetical protein